MRKPLLVAALVGTIALAGCSSASLSQGTTDETRQEGAQESVSEDDAVDKSGLEEAVSDAESVTLDSLSASTYSNLSNAYNDAKALIEDDGAKQFEVDSAQRALLSALDRAKQESESRTDEFTIVEAHAEPVDSYGYFDMVITVRNNTDEAKEFQGVDIAELDSSGNIINSYMSYNKNAVDTVVDPGQQLSISLTCSADDGIAGVRCTKYEYGPFGSQTEGKFSETFTQMF